MKHISTTHICKAPVKRQCGGVFFDTFFSKNASMESLYSTTISGISKDSWFFTFTGKERDEETGYGYFGARYMDHELMTMWLSVDPMADKYPGISPYNYCMWNPVKLIDPDGREVKFDPESEEILNEFERELETKMTNINCIPRDKKECEVALNEIRMLRESNQMYHIEAGSSDNYFYEGGIKYNIEKNRVDITFSNYAGLSHELKHAYQFETGELSFESTSGSAWLSFLYDVYDEYYAYKRGELFGGKRETIEHIMYTCKLKIEGKRYYYPFLSPPDNLKANNHNNVYQGHNTVRSLTPDDSPDNPYLKGNIFRINGTTYVK